MRKDRDSNFELLRIIAMLMIVMHHLAVHGGAIITDASPALNVAFLRFFELGGKLAVNAFVLISGYFLVKSKFKPEKLFGLMVEIFLYSTVIYFVFVSFGRVAFDWKSLVFSFLPVSTNSYWFMTCYVLLYLLAPLLNIVLKNITKVTHITIIIVMLFVCSIVPLFAGHLLSNVGWFVLLYLTAAYIAMYPKIFAKKWVFVVLSTVLYLAIVLFKLLGNISLYQMNNPLCYSCAICMFVMFKNIKIKHNPIINFVSSATLGIYLIHDNNYVRPFIWQKIFVISEIFQTASFWWKAILIVLFVFIACLVVDVLRRLLFAFFDNFVKFNFLDKKKGNFLSA